MLSRLRRSRRVASRPVVSSAPLGQRCITLHLKEGGSVTARRGDRRAVKVDYKPISRGRYRVSWRVTSGYEVTGVRVFFRGGRGAEVEIADSARKGGRYDFQSSNALASGDPARIQVYYSPDYRR